jgi:hypothetical protein
VSNAQLSAVEAEIKSRLAHCRRLTDTAESEKRKLFDFEKADL